MNFEEIKAAINDRAVELLKAINGIAAHADYSLEDICGMLEDFELAGMLTGENEYGCCIPETWDQGNKL